MNYFEAALNDIEEIKLAAETGLKYMGEPHNTTTEETADRWQGIINRCDSALSYLAEVEFIYQIDRSCAECEREHGPNYSGECTH